MGYQYSWLPLTSYFGNGKHSKNINLGFSVIGGGLPGALGRNSYTQLFNLENPQDDSHLTEETIREQTLKFKITMIGEFAETERRFELKLSQSHSILADLRQLYLSGKFQEEQHYSRVLFNIKQITNLKVTNDFNKAFEANFNDFAGYNSTNCYRECSKHGRCVASENKRFYYCQCIDSRFGVSCNLNKEMYDLLLNI